MTQRHLALSRRCKATMCPSSTNREGDHLKVPLFLQDEVFPMSQPKTAEFEMNL